jgi:hypothetical protein
MFSYMAAEETGAKRTRILTSFIVISLVLVFLTAFTKFIFAKDYYFYIESECDESSEICFTRDCEEYCPPNGLDTYKAYYIPASAFPQCEDNGCNNICEGDASNVCEELECDAENGDVCRLPPL